MNNINFTDIHEQYINLQDNINKAIQNVLNHADFIDGADVKDFETQLSLFSSSKFSLGVANGTDALIIALMALDLEKDAEIITPSFSFIAATEAITLLGLKPILVDVDPHTMLINPHDIEKAITPKTRAIIPVHLFGQCAPMEPISQIAKKYNLYIIEDACQAIGSIYTFPDGTTKHAGTMGDFGCISFFPTKNLGGFGDGGAILTQKQNLYTKTKMIAHHGALTKYNNDILGFNSRLDTLQAAILNVKLKSLNQYINKRQQIAQYYNNKLMNLTFIQTPTQAPNTTHTYHQYVLQISDQHRYKLQQHLSYHHIPTAVYYPKALHQLNTFQPQPHTCTNSEILTQKVLAIPLHPHLDLEQVNYIINIIKKFIP